MKKYKKISQLDLLKCEFEIQHDYIPLVYWQHYTPIYVYAKKLNTSNYQVRKIIGELEKLGYVSKQIFYSDFETIEYDWEIHGNYNEEKFKPLKFKAFRFNDNLVNETIKQKDYNFYKKVKQKYEESLKKYL